MAIKADKQQALDALREVYVAAASLMAERGDSSAPAVGSWSVKDVAAHLAATSSSYIAFARGERSDLQGTAERADWNERNLAPLRHKPAAELAEIYRSNIAELLGIAEGIEGDRQVPWMADIEMPVSSLVLVALGEAILHGRDMAEATGVDWSIDPGHARLTIMGLLPVLPHFVRSDVAGGLTARFEMRLRGGPRFHLAFSDGRLAVEEPAAARVDCYVSVDPVAYLLVGYGRESRWTAIATRKMMAWGRKPWLSLKLTRVFETP